MADPCRLCDQRVGETSSRMVVPVRWRRLPAGGWKTALTAYVNATRVVACAEDPWPPIGVRVQFVLRFSVMDDRSMPADIRCTGTVTALSACSRSAAVAAAVLTIEHYRITAAEEGKED